MTLDQVRRGQTVQICSVPENSFRAQAIRFGIDAGETVICTEKLPAGPVVLRKHHQEIAVGHRLAKQIHVKPA